MTSGQARMETRIMTDAMIAEAIRAAGGAQGAQVAGAGQAAAIDPAAVAKFEVAMETPEVTAIPFAQQVSEAWRTAQDNNQGIIHRIKALSEMSDMHGPASGNLLELQYEVANLAFQQEVVTSVAKKASDAISTLVKNG